MATKARITMPLFLLALFALASCGAAPSTEQRMAPLAKGNGDDVCLAQTVEFYWAVSGEEPVKVGTIVAGHWTVIKADPRTVLYGQLVGSYDLRRVDGTSGHAVNISAPVIHAASTPSCGVFTPGTRV